MPAIRHIYTGFFLFAGDPVSGGVPVVCPVFLNHTHAHTRAHIRTRIGIFGTQTAIFRLRKHKFSIKK